jgi:integrase
MASGYVVRCNGKGGVTYRVRVDAGPDPTTGKRQQPYLPERFATEREAERRLRAWLRDAEQGRVARPTKMTVRDLCIEWLDGAARQRVRDTTLEDYEATVRVHVLPRLGNEPIQKLTTAAIQHAYTQMMRDGHRERVRALFVARLRSALKYAVRMQYLTYNPAEGVEVIPGDRREMQVWTADQAQRFLRVAKDHPYQPFWELALTTGMRRGEILALRWAEVDLAGETLSVRRSVGPLRGRPHFDEPKNGRARVIDLDAATVALLRGHRAHQNERRLCLADAWQDQDLVCASSVGTPINPNNITRAYDDLVTLAGVPRIRVHDLRHTAATLMLQAGIPIKVVSERLGHATITITLNLYAHVLPGMQKQAAETLGQLLRGTGPDTASQGQPERQHSHGDMPS